MSETKLDSSDCSAWQILHGIGITCAIANTWLSEMNTFVAIGITCYLVILFPSLVLKQNVKDHTS